MKALLIALLLAAQQPPDDVAQKIDAAAQLVDEGKVDDAIAALKKIVAAHPKNGTAAYELALAYAAKGDHAHCRTLAQPLAARDGREQLAAIALLGNCLDALKQHPQALATYRKGLALAPNDSQLLYNYALSIVRDDDKLDEARQVLKKDLRANPSDAAAHDLLGDVFAAQGYRAQAVFSYLRFLALDPSSPNAQDTATRLRAMLNDSKIDLKPDERKDEGDYAALNLLLAAGAATRGSDEEAKLSEFEQLRRQLSHLVEQFLISVALKGGDDYTAAVQTRFFAEMQQEKLVDTFAGIALASLPIAGRDEWAKANEAEVERYGRWLAPHLDRPVVHLK